MDKRPELQEQVSGRYGLTGAQAASSALSVPRGSTRSLEDVSLVANVFGDGEVFARILSDWFEFIGGRPGQVVIIDNGSPRESQIHVIKAYESGLIDKLVLVRPGHCDTGNHQVYIGEHAAPAIATKPYLLWVHIDTLPFRQGHEDWLSEAVSYLERSDVFAVGGSYNVDCKHHDAWPGWYFSHKCSENFALMKRSEFIHAMEEFCGGYISSGYRGTNPAAGQGRFLLEVAFERYIQNHQKFTLMREEDPTWTIFHTNVHGERLAAVRKDYLARKGITMFMNAGCNGTTAPGLYYGQPALTRWFKRLQHSFGNSKVGPLWRTLKRSLVRLLERRAQPSPESR